MDESQESGTIFFGMNLVERERSDCWITEEGFLFKKLDNFAIVPLEKYEELTPAIRELLKKAAK